MKTAELCLQNSLERKLMFICSVREYKDTASGCSHGNNDVENYSMVIRCKLQLKDKVLSNTKQLRGKRKEDGKVSFENQQLP